MDRDDDPIKSNIRNPTPDSVSEINQLINEDNPHPIVMTPGTAPTMSERKVVKNLIILGFSLFSYFLGFFALSNLQSTVNSQDGLGTDSQAAIYASSMVASLILPELLVKSIGCKKTLVLAVICSIPYIASNYFPRWDTLIPTAVLLGISAGPLTTSQAIYTNEMARRYHKFRPGEDFEVIVARFFGVYAFFNENTQIWGNMISYYVLRPNMTSLHNITRVNCGVNFRNINASNSTNPNLQPPTEGQKNLLVTIYVLFGVLSVMMMILFLDPLINDIDSGAPTKRKCISIFDRLVAAIKHAGKLDQLLLLPLSIFSGMEMAFYTTDFTQAFIACSWGVHHVGFVTICFGVCGALMSILVGPLVKYISQMSVIILAAVINVVTCAMLFIWQPSPDTPALYFVFAGVLGVTDAIWWSQIPALYGLMFPNDREAAFSNFFFWSFFGYFISYSYANYFTVAVKINIMLVFLIVGILLFIVGQIKIKCSPKIEYVEIEESEG